MASEQDLHRLAALFDVLSDPDHFRILTALAAGEKTNDDLRKQLNTTTQTVCYNLKLLRRAKVVIPRRVRKWAFYRLAAEVRFGKDHLLEVSAERLVVRIHPAEG